MLGTKECNYREYVALFKSMGERGNCILLTVFLSFWGKREGRGGLKRITLEQMENRKNDTVKSNTLSLIVPEEQLGWCV